MDKPLDWTNWLLHGLPGDRDDCDDCAIVRTILDLGRPLIQGFLFGRPMALDALVRHFRRPAQ